MGGFEVHRAVADADRAWAVAQTTSPFTIEVRFRGGLSDAQREAFAAAADRWAGVIVGDLPDARVGDETVDDVRIEASGIEIDGPSAVLGRAGPTVLRSASAGPAAGLPVTGIMEFDSADLAQMEQAGTLHDVITHEMGHVLGLGTLWSRKGLLRGAGTADPVFTGAGALAEYRTLRPGATGAGVPVENAGGPGTRDGHWRESVFGDELMTGFVGESGNPLSRMSVASFGDLGYQVDPDAAEAYALPAPGAARRGKPERHTMLRTTTPGQPTVLTD